MADRRTAKKKTSGTDKHPGSQQEEYRAARESLEPLTIRGLTSIDHMTLLARNGLLVEASTTGFLLEVERRELAPKVFRDSLSLKELEGDKVYMMIDAMNLEVGGVITRTHRLSKDRWQIAIDFREDAPEYWRECLLEFLPRPGGF
ncbi:MAG: hypothetical protein RBT63_09525 [Bdellovibrionales bacterium]|jgi:hypothetical protein|nr:hypothetical protein [Bdellovibrionales bacterium]